MQDQHSKFVETEIIRALTTIARLTEHSVIDHHQDLLEFVDSFGFVQLLMSIEAPLGVELDLTSVDLGSIARFGDLVTFVTKYVEEVSATELVDIE